MYFEPISPLFSIINIVSKCYIWILSYPGPNLNSSIYLVYTWTLNSQHTRLFTTKSYLALAGYHWNPSRPKVNTIYLFKAVLAFWVESQNICLSHPVKHSPDAFHPLHHKDNNPHLLLTRATLRYLWPEAELFWSTLEHQCPQSILQK